MTNETAPAAAFDAAQLALAAALVFATFVLAWFTRTCFKTSAERS